MNTKCDKLTELIQIIMRMEESEICMLKLFEKIYEQISGE